MTAIGYVRVSTDNAGLLDIIVDGGESAKSLQRPGMERLLALLDGMKVQAVIVAHWTDPPAA
jgi:DNA invertase Pin-like site-specific DNA recombinase